MRTNVVHFIVLGFLLLCSSSTNRAEHSTPATLTSLSIEELVNVSIGQVDQVASIFQSKANQISSTSLNIGLLAPTNYFPETVVAADLAASFINSHNGINGKRLAILHANTELDSTTAGALALTLIEQFKVQGLIGPATSSSAEEVLNTVALNKSIPIISHTASSDALTRLSKNGLFWRLVANNAQQTKLIMDTLDAQSKYTGIAIVGNRDMYSKEIAEGLKSIINQKPELAFDEMFVSDLVYLEGMSLKYQIKRLQDKGINAIVLSLQLNQLNAFIRKINDHWKGPLPTIITTDVAKFSYLDNYNHGNIRQCMYVYQSLTSGINSELITQVKNLVKTDEADYDSAYIFDAIMIFAMAKQIELNQNIKFKQAIKLITSDGHPINFIDYPNILKLLEQHKTLSYQGYTGQVKFDDFGNNITAQKAIVPLSVNEDIRKICYKSLNKS